MTRVLGAVVLIGLTACHGSDALDAWPAALATQSPTTQAGLTGFPVNDPPAVRLLDADGRGIPGARISFTVTTGPGSGSTSVVTTGSDGVATFGAWTIGAGANGVRASIPREFRVPPVTFSAIGSGAAYHIDLEYLTPISPVRRAVFDSAAAHWERVIYGDVPDIDLSFNPIPPDRCFPGQPAIGGVIDDVLIHVILDSIDGPGKILGRATPCFIRSTGKLPLHGVMAFDTADVAQLEALGVFDDVILHEMGHVLGFGTIWGSNYLSLLVGPAALGGNDPHFIGSRARTVFDRIGGTSYTGGQKVPVENTGGPGTVDGHWRESVFDNELMTGFLDGGSNPLSIVTVASQGDEGYAVNYAAADPYTHTFTAAAHAAPGAPGTARIALGDDVLRLPIHVVDRHGRITGVYRR